MNIRTFARVYGVLFLLHALLVAVAAYFGFMHHGTAAGETAPARAR